jgi:hypothetical protein
MGYAAKIIEKFKGTRPMAATLNLPPTTVQSWKESGRIPDRHKQRVLEKARQEGIELSLADFFDLPEELKKSRRAGTA